MKKEDQDQYLLQGSLLTIVPSTLVVIIKKYPLSVDKITIQKLWSCHIIILCYIIKFADYIFTYLQLPVMMYKIYAMINLSHNLE